MEIFCLVAKLGKVNPTVGSKGVIKKYFKKVMFNLEENTKSFIKRGKRNKRYHNEAIIERVITINILTISNSWSSFYQKQPL